MGDRSNPKLGRVPYWRLAVLSIGVAIISGGLAVVAWLDSLQHIEGERIRIERAVARMESLNIVQTREYAQTYAHVDSALAEGVDSLQAEVFRGERERNRMRRELYQINRALEAQARLLRNGGR